MKKKKKFVWCIRRLFLIPAIVLIGVIGVTLAKYVIEQFNSYYLNSKNFYFSSNRLTSNNALYQVNNWSGVGSFTISFDLLSVKNSYVYTNYDIPYTITYTCPQQVLCTADKDAGTIYSASNTHSDTIILSVVPQRTYSESESLTIHISASSTAPYVKTISADFEYIVGKQGVTYEIEDEANQPYLMLKITNAISYCEVVTAFGNYSVGDTIDNSIYRTLGANKSKCVSQVIGLSFDPTELLLDTTSNVVDQSTYTTTTVSGVDYISSLTFNISPVSTTAIKFYKIDATEDYTYPFENSTSIIGVTITDP